MQGWDGHDHPLYKKIIFWKDSPMVKKLVIDDILALYLIDSAKSINQEGYKAFVSFTGALRDCLAAHGWEKLHQKSNDQAPPYCQTKNAKRIPKI
jgi:hypothetical protein